MSRQDDARNRAALRWDFVRRNGQYRADYEKFKGDKEKLLDPALFEGLAVSHFLNKFCVYPLNPKFAFADIQKAQKQKGKNGACLREAVHHLSELKLSSRRGDAYSRITAVDMSYLTKNKNIQAYRLDPEDGDFIGLTDSSKGLGGDSFIERCDEDLLKVTMELDLSYSTKAIVEDIKKEISLWKQVGQKYSKGARGRQNLFDADVKKMLCVFDLRQAGVTFKKIAKRVFNAETVDAIQRTRNMYSKAKRYSDGEYKQIR